MRSAMISAAPEDPVVEPLQPPGLPRQSQPTSAISPADEARLIARAVSLIKRYDFSGARLLLEHALQQGSAPAAFMMAETYDWRMLRSMPTHGVRGNSEKAQELYQQAAVAGIEKARERLEALKSHSPPDAVSFGGRKAQHKESSQQRADVRRIAGNFEWLANLRRQLGATTDNNAALNSGEFSGKATK